MKHLFTFIVFQLFAIGLYAQVQTIDTYSLSAYGTSYSISANIDCRRGVFSDPLYVFAESGNDDFAVLRMNESNVQHLVNKLTEAKNTYLEWSRIAKTKKMKQLSKKIMPLKGSCWKIFFTNGGSWYADSDAELFAVFYVDRAGTCYLKIESETLFAQETIYKERASRLAFAYNMNMLAIASSLQTRTIKVTKTMNGIQMAFSSADEIETFLNKLQDAIEWKKKNTSDGKLLMPEP